ncbi:PR domain zinc finger protein 10-like isoform X2 [Hippocampus comes]|uniref:PR domain zinc finger protein 10-like isoform X2 n=1 Tax=Hippocampus comes TaxID=109280 RepID=UPI00094E9B64|nr:PREDICTED: PR domain zinc finger protein 10-like isoform X2 [Hippocampus comes]
MKVEDVIVGTNMSNTDPEMKSGEDYDDPHCPQCLITFRSSETRKNHMRRTHPEQYSRHLMQNHTLFSCYKCDRLFGSPEELKVHSGLHHQADDIPVCSSCSKVFTNFSGLYRHKRKGCVEGVWRCRDCGVRCRSLMDFHLHCIEDHDKDVVSAAQSGGRLCSICWRHFLTDEALRNHQDRVDGAVMQPTVKRNLQTKTMKMHDKKKKKKKKRVEDDDDANKDNEEDKEEEKLRIPCPEDDCDLVFPSIDALRAHKRSQHPAQPPSSLGHNKR